MVLPRWLPTGLRRPIHAQDSVLVDLSMDRHGRVQLPASFLSVLGGQGVSGASVRRIAEDDSDGRDDGSPSRKVHRQGLGVMTSPMKHKVRTSIDHR